MVMCLRAEDTSSLRQRLHSYATKGTKGKMSLERSERIRRFDCQFDVPRNLIAHVTPGSPWETVILGNSISQTATRTTASLHRPIMSNGIPPLGRKVIFAAGFGLCPGTG